MREPQPLTIGSRTEAVRSTRPPRNRRMRTQRATQAAQSVVACGTRHDTELAQWPSIQCSPHTKCGCTRTCLDRHGQRHGHHHRTGPRPRRADQLQTHVCSYVFGACVCVCVRVASPKAPNVGRVRFKGSVQKHASCHAQQRCFVQARCLHRAEKVSSNAMSASAANDLTACHRNKDVVGSFV